MLFTQSAMTKSFLPSFLSAFLSSLRPQSFVPCCCRATHILLRASLFQPDITVDGSKVGRLTFFAAIPPPPPLHPAIPTHVCTSTTVACITVTKFFSWWPSVSDVMVRTEESEWQSDSSRVMSVYQAVPEPILHRNRMARRIPALLRIPCLPVCRPDLGVLSTWNVLWRQSTFCQTARHVYQVHKHKLRHS